MVNTATELTFTLSAHTNYKVKTLTINGTTYSAVTDNTITQKVKIEKNTAVSATLETASNPTPDAGTFTDTQGNNVTIAPVKAYGGEITGYRLAGDIYIEELNSEAFKAKLNTLNGKELYTDSLNINCFTSQNSTITAKVITPELLTGVLTIGKEKNFSAFKLNNKATDTDPINIPFESTKTDYFDITDLAKFKLSDNFKLTENSVIFLRAERELDMPGTEDNTKYAKTTELLSLVNNPKIKHKITVGKVQLRGNVKDLLPLLVEGPNKIKEADGGITFGKAFETPCTGENWTGYNGIVNDNGNVNNTGRSILKAEEFLELKKRSGGKQTYVRNAIITGLDSKNLSPEQLADAQFEHDILTNVNFKNCDLSKIEMIFLTAGTGTLKFENTTLPRDMYQSVIGTLILKNATLPEELKTTQLEDILSGLPVEIGTLKIYNLQGRFLDQYTEEEIQQIKKQWQNYGNRLQKAPKKYAGPQDVWNKLKLLFQENPVKTHFTNEDLTDVDNDNINFSALQKPQDTFLDLLGNSKAHG